MGLYALRGFFIITPSFISRIKNMDIFLLLFENLIPLYVLIALGFVAGRYLGVDIKSLGALAIYIFMPIAVFGYIVKLDFKPVYIGLPLLVYISVTALAFAWLNIARRIYPDDGRSILLTMCCIWGNTGYFGLPLVIALFPEDVVGIYMFMMVGNILFEATIGYYIWMRGGLNVRQSLIKVLKFPSLYAVCIGLALNFADYSFGEQTQTYWEYCRGMYIVLGMMIIGAALGQASKLIFSLRFVSLAFLGKFVVWPLFALVFIALDKDVFHVFNHTSHQMFFILSIVPPGANIVAFAGKLDMYPAKAATTIVVGTIMALLTIPLCITLSGLF